MFYNMCKRLHWGVTQSPLACAEKEVVNVMMKQQQVQTSGMVGGNRHSLWKYLLRDKEACIKQFIVNILLLMFVFLHLPVRAEDEKQKDGMAELSSQDMKAELGAGDLNPNQIVSYQSPDGDFIKRWPILSLAIDARSIASIRSLLEYGADPNNLENGFDPITCYKNFINIKNKGGYYA